MKRRSVIFSPEARKDLVELYEWVATAAGARVAMAYVERLEAYCLGFVLAAARGHQRDDLHCGAPYCWIRASDHGRIRDG